MSLVNFLPTSSMLALKCSLIYIILLFPLVLCVNPFHLIVQAAVKTKQESSEGRTKSCDPSSYSSSHCISEANNLFTTPPSIDPAGIYIQRLCCLQKERV